ncbi:hypothetical protein ACIXIS_17610, partial [Bacteroides fragilis]
ATKIGRFFRLCKSFYIILIISHLSILLASSAESKNDVSKDVRLLKHHSPKLNLHLSQPSWSIKGWFIN